MKKIVRKIAICWMSGLLLLGAASCNSWLDLLPPNDQTTDKFWESEDEVKGVLFSSYNQLRNCLEEFILWGELRGDGIAYTYVDKDPGKIKSLDILVTNEVCKWDNLYTAIGRANSVLKYGPGVLEKDPTFAPEVLNSYAAEAIFIRSLCYFYLTRTFGSVPLVLEPYVDDTQDFAVASSSEEVVLDQITRDLEQYMMKCKTGYESDGSMDWQNKGRATRWAYRALLADIYLWRGQYDKCIQQCDEIAKGPFMLMEKEEWFEIFYPGNSAEGIFELQWSKIMGGSTNKIYEWFYNGTKETTYLVTGNSVELFSKFADRDVRGLNGTFLDGNNKLWKYGGTGFFGLDGADRGEQADNNWIFYRYADVLLMKAEALVMKGDISGAYDIVEQIRIRAGYTGKIDMPATEFDGLMMVIEERHREFIGEGKRWFDILRVAKRDNYKYKQYLLDVLLADVSAKKYAEWFSKLSDVNSYYLPIHKSEIENGKGKLEQNPYYKELD